MMRLDVSCSKICPKRLQSRIRVRESVDSAFICSMATPTLKSSSLIILDSPSFGSSCSKVECCGFLQKMLGLNHLGHLGDTLDREIRVQAKSTFPLIDELR